MSSVGSLAKYLHKYIHIYIYLHSVNSIITFVHFHLSSTGSSLRRVVVCREEFESSVLYVYRRSRCQMNRENEESHGALADSRHRNEQCMINSHFRLKVRNCLAEIDVRIYIRKIETCY